MGWSLLAPLQDQRKMPRRLSPLQGRVTLMMCSASRLCVSARGEEEDEATRRRCIYPKIRIYFLPKIVKVNSGWYEGENCMDPTEVAPPVHRMGRPNLDGSMGGYKAHALTLLLEDRTYFYY